MSSKKVEIAANGGSQVFLSDAAQKAITDIQMKFVIRASEKGDYEAVKRYTGRGVTSMIIEDMAKEELHRYDTK